MPTRDRPHLAPLAIKCFLQQTHPDRELLILDDGQKSLIELIPKDPRIQYYSGAQTPQTLGTKLNTLAKLARGHILCNWDDDDWSSNDRLEHQLASLAASGKAVTGFHSFYYYDVTTRRCHLWRNTGRKPSAPGSSEMYTRAWLLENPLPDLTLPVDRYFVENAILKDQITTEPGVDFLVARYHPNNCWRNTPTNRGYPIVHRSRLPQQFFTDAGIP
jgi:glycosyltransferase involved in cell wall biosynthesis